jgi:hypothetical protein
VAGHDTPSVVEYAITFLILLFVWVACWTWLYPVLSNPAMYSPGLPLRGLG